MFRVGLRSLWDSPFRSADTSGQRRSLATALLALALIAVLGVVPAIADAGSPPVIDSESASHISSTDATLEASINSQEAPAGDYYQFQVVANPSEFASEILCPSTRPQGSEYASALNHPAFRRSDFTRAASSTSKNPSASTSTAPA